MECRTIFRKLQWCSSLYWNEQKEQFSRKRKKVCESSYVLVTVRPILLVKYFC
jgi:hypothetical protein